MPLTLEQRVEFLESVVHQQQRMLNETVNSLAQAWLNVQRLAAAYLSLTEGDDDAIPGDQPTDAAASPRQH